MKTSKEEKKEPMGVSVDSAVQAIIKEQSVLPQWKVAVVLTLILVFGVIGLAFTNAPTIAYWFLVIPVVLIVLLFSLRRNQPSSKVDE